MGTYAFKALDLSGTSTRGELEADDKQAVAAQLRSKGLIVLDIEEKKSAADIGDMIARFKKVKAQELTIATRQLSTMVSSGMSLLRALYVLEEQTGSDKLREALVQIRKDVEAGISLSDALRRHPDIFNDLYIAMVEAGELGGILESTLQRVADQLEKDDSLRRQVKSAMMYPMMIGGFALTVLLALVTFLVLGAWHVRGGWEYVASSGKVGRAICDGVEAADDLVLAGRADPALDTPLSSILDDCDVVGDSECEPHVHVRKRALRHW